MVMPKGRVPVGVQKQLLAADRRVKKATEELYAAVMAAHLDGSSVRELAALLGRSPTTIQQWLKAERERHPI